MAPHLEVIPGGKLASAKGRGTLADSATAQVELMIARYVETMLIQLEAVSRLVKIDDLADSLGAVRQEARAFVRQLNQPV